MKRTNIPCNPEKYDSTVSSVLSQIDILSARIRLASTVAAILLLIAKPACAAERQKVHGHVPAAAARLEPKGPLSAMNRLKLAIGLPLRNQEALALLLRQLYDPASTNYHRYLTPEQFTQKFGPTEQDYDALIDFARSNHLNVTVMHPNRVVLDVEGSVTEIEKTFHLNMRLYQHPSEPRTFYGPDAEPSLDLSVRVLHISGLDNYGLPHPHSKSKPIEAALTSNAGSGPSGSLRGNDFRAAYVPDTSLTGTGQSVGLVQFDGYYANDITTYERQAGLPNVELINVAIDGGVPVPGPNNAEVCLDIEMVISMAPGISRIYVYEAPNPSPWVDLLSRMANDNLAKQLSCSWGGGGPDATAEQIFQQMAAQGQSFFNASGDSDAFTGAIDFPAESPNITEVGGTTLSTTGPGGSYVSEKVWNWGNMGSSGGMSTYYSIPFYQQDILMSANHGSTTMRNVPDVALTADNVYVVYNNGDTGIFGGTSCAAPLWAGLTALINQQAVANGYQTAGFLNPALYSLSKNPNFSSIFHDITTGNNTSSSSPSLFYAASGYDLCTGWGTPAGQAFIDAVAGAVRVDTTFNATGQVTTDFNLIDLVPPASINALALQKDGKIVAAGSLAGYDNGALARYNGDGTLDTTFGEWGSGIVLQNIYDSTNGNGYAVAVRASDQKIAVAGMYANGDGTSRFGVLRYLPNGRLDTTFNGGGMALGQFPGQTRSAAKALAFQRDGMLVVAGNTGRGIGLVRYLDNGQLDSSFGAGGFVITRYGVFTETRAMAIQADGKIVLAGAETGTYFSNPHFLVLRYNLDGSPDTSFGTAGNVVTDFSGSSVSSDAANCLAIQADGKIIVAGSANQNSAWSGYQNFAAARYLPNGTPDSTFGTEGKALVDFDFGMDEAHAVAVLSDGRLVLAGSSDCCNNGATDFAVARLNANGTPDTSFGPNADGRAHITFAANSPALANAAVLDGDGRLIIAGATAPAGVSDLSAASDFALTRVVMGEHPFHSVPLRVPGLIEAEDYDNGGPGLSYADTTVNWNDATGAYGSDSRPGSGVDLETDSDGGNNVHVAYIHAGEWLQYSINSLIAGPYHMRSRVSCAGNGGTFHVEIDGTNVTGPVVVPNTGGWLNFQTVSTPDMTLPSGKHQLRVVFDTNGVNGWYVANLNYLEFFSDFFMPLGLIKSSPNTVTVYWPNWAYGFILQSSVDLETWADVSQPPVGFANAYYVTLPATDAKQFFRLVRQDP